MTEAPPDLLPDTHTAVLLRFKHKLLQEGGSHTCLPLPGLSTTKYQRTITGFFMTKKDSPWQGIKERTIIVLCVCVFFFNSKQIFKNKNKY